MKKLGKGLLLAAAVALGLLILTRQLSVFQGSRQADAQGLALEYAIFHGTETHTLELEAGDTLEVETVDTEGSVDLSISQQEGKPVYTGKGLPTGRFQVGISKPGRYIVTVAGHWASGGIWVEKAERG